MALKTRKALWAFKQESVAGTVESLAAANVVKAVSEGLELGSITPLLFADNTVHSELGEHPDFAPNIASWDLPTVSIALAGHTATSNTTVTKVPWGHLLEACGFEALDGDSGTNEVVKLTIGAISGATLFRHGETVTASGTGESGVVIGDTWNGTTTLYVEMTGAGSFDALDVLTGGSSGATATIATGGVQTRNPHAYRMVSEPDDSVSLTAGLYYDGKLIRAKGCRGNVVLRLDHANRAFLDFSYKGIVHNAGASTYHVTDTSFPTGVEYGDALAQPSLGLGLTLNNGSLTVTPGFNRLQLDMGMGTVLQENTNSASGWDAARITTRAPRLRFNPREVLESEFTFWDDFARGVTARGRFTIGTISGKSKFTFIMPFLQAANLGGADRNGEREWDGEWKCTKGAYVDGSGNTAFGENNEVVIIHDYID